MANTAGRDFVLAKNSTTIPLMGVKGVMIR